MESMDPNDTIPGDPERSRFERWRRRVAEITGLGLDERRRNLQHAQHITCEKWKDYLLNYSRFMLYLTIED